MALTTFLGRVVRLAWGADQNQEETDEEGMTTKPESEKPGKPVQKKNIMYKWRTMMRVRSEKSIEQPPSDGTEGGGGNVCLVARSPYRILRSAASGNLKSFQKLYLEDPKRLDFRDEQRGRGAAHYAASNNKTEILQYILSVGGDIFGKDNQGQTPLHVAVESSSLDAVSILIDCGAALDTLNSWQQSPFHLAVSADRPDVLRLLLTYRHLVDCTQLTEHGSDALHIAAVFNRAECARILLNDFGMRPDHVCRNGFIPMHEAARRASLDAMRVLVEWDEQHKTSLIQQPDADGSLPLHLAVHSGDVKVVKLCLDYGAVITSQQSDFSTPVHLACVQGSLEMTQLMLTEQPKEKWVVMDQRDAASMTILHCAAKFDHSALVEYLHEQGADLAAVDSEQRTPLLLAAEQASWSAVHTLLALGSAPDTIEKRRRNLVHFLVLNGGQLQLLINANPKNTSALVKLLNGQDYEGSTPLHYAARDGQVRCMQELLQHGAGPDVKNAFNENPLHCASRSGRYQAVEILLASEMSQYIINGIDQAGRTPLHGACDNGHLRVVHLLISRGALLNRDFDGMSPLHLAVRAGYTRTMRLLLGTHTQLLDQKDKAGNTALHLACQSDQPAAVRLLLSYDCTLVANAAGYTALDIGIKQKLTEVVRVMLTNKVDSRRALSDTQGKNKYTTAALIDVMPKIMKEVMDQHIIVASDKNNAEMLSITYDLSLFEPCELQIQAMRAARGDADWRPQPLTAVNHMVRHGQIELLTHPLTQKYLEMKWSAYGRVCHMLSLLLYTGFVILETAHGMHLMVLVGKCKVLLEDEGTLVVAGLADPTEDEDSCTAASRVFFSSRTSPVEHATMLAVIVFGALNVFKKAVQLWTQGWRFIVDFENYLELCLYLSAVFSVTPVVHPTIHHVHIISTAMAIFLAWFKMLLYLRSFESVGIYVVMFVEIQKTLLRVLVIFSLLIIAFGLAFFILMSPGNHPEFNSVQVALSRTFNMMLGEIDFLTVYVYPGMAATTNGTGSADRAGGGRRIASAGNSALGPRFLPFATSSFLLVIVFMVMIPILLMNLLVGLAVGDIETVRKNAALKRLAMQVDLHTSLEGKLPRAFLEKVRRSEVVEHPHEVASGAAASPSLHAYRGVIRFVMHLFTPSHGGAQRRFDHLEHEAAAEQNRQRQEMEKLKRRLKANSDAIDSVLHLVRMMAARMEVAADGQDEAGVGVERSLRRNDLERATSARSSLRVLPP